MKAELPAGYHSTRWTYEAANPHGSNLVAQPLFGYFRPAVAHPSLDAALATFGSRPALEHAVHQHYLFGMNSKGG